VQATRLDRCECAREVGVGEPTAHRLVASADGQARRGGGGHGAVEAITVGVRAGRFEGPSTPIGGGDLMMGRKKSPETEIGIPNVRLHQIGIREQIWTYLTEGSTTLKL